MHLRVINFIFNFLVNFFFGPCSWKLIFYSLNPEIKFRVGRYAPSSICGCLWLPVFVICICSCRQLSLFVICICRCRQLSIFIICIYRCKQDLAAVADVDTCICFHWQQLATVNINCICGCRSLIIIKVLVNCGVD